MLHWVFAPFCLATMAGVSISIDIEIFHKISIDIESKYKNTTSKQHYYAMHVSVFRPAASFNEDG